MSAIRVQPEPPHAYLSNLLPATGDADETDRLQLLSRIQQITQGMKYSELAEWTGCHRETVRRYTRIGNPSALFLARLCRALGINGDWLLTGRGETAYEETVRLHEVAASDLLACLAARQRAAEAVGRSEMGHGAEAPIPQVAEMDGQRRVCLSRAAPQGALMLP